MREMPFRRGVVADPEVARGQVVIAERVVRVGLEERAIGVDRLQPIAEHNAVIGALGQVALAIRHPVPELERLRQSLDAARRVATSVSHAQLPPAHGEVAVQRDGLLEQLLTPELLSQEEPRTPPLVVLLKRFDRRRRHGLQRGRGSDRGQRFADPLPQAPGELVDGGHDPLLVFRRFPARDQNSAVLGGNDLTREHEALTHPTDSARNHARHAGADRQFRRRRQVEWCVLRTLHLAEHLPDTSRLRELHGGRLREIDPEGFRNRAGQRRILGRTLEIGEHQPRIFRQHVERDQSLRAGGSRAHGQIRGGDDAQQGERDGGREDRLSSSGRPAG